MAAHTFFPTLSPGTLVPMRTVLVWGVVLSALLAALFLYMPAASAAAPVLAGEVEETTTTTTTTLLPEDNGEGVLPILQEGETGEVGVEATTTASELLPFTATALRECGEIVAPAEWQLGQPLVRTPIADCADPFTRTVAPSPYTLLLDGMSATDGTVVEREGAMVARVRFDGWSQGTSPILHVFLHEGNDLVHTDLSTVRMTDADYLTFFAQYFTTPAEQDFYRTVHEAVDQRSYFFDAEGEDRRDVAGYRVADRYYDAVYAAEEYYESLLVAPLTAGTYTFVLVEHDLNFSQQGSDHSVAVAEAIPSGDRLRVPVWLANLGDFLLPTAYAAVFPPETRVFTWTVTIATLPPPPPLGASSILFLPGIMGSHLYEKSDVCTGWGEQRRWFSHTDCEQSRLLLDEAGNSLYDIYTKEGEEGIMADVTVGGRQIDSTYAAFIAAMNEQVGETVAAFTPFPYDWRLKLSQLLQLQKNDRGEVRYVQGLPYTDGLLYTKIRDMATESYSGKVTIVAHSNGGLVARAFLAKLAAEQDPLATKIDNLILVGSPQVGTPDAVTSLLHGAALVGGWVVSAEMSRHILNDAPMGYHLMPNEQYFAGEGVSVETPVVVFDTGTATAPYITQFGSEINTEAGLAAYIGTVSERPQPEHDDLYTPAVGNDTLLAYAEEMANTLAEWTPPGTMRVYQLAGSGIWTPKTLRYFSGTHCVDHVLPSFGCREYEPQLQHETYFTRDGDGTVVLPSALAMTETDTVERWWLNILRYNNTTDSSYQHKNMMEIEEVSDYIQAVAAGSLSSSSYRYISVEKPLLTGEHQLRYRLHSPLDMYLTSSLGILSSTTNTIPGAQYRRIGETQYLFVPASINDATVHLVGYAAGSFTLVGEEWQGDTLVTKRDYVAVPSATSTVATLAVGGVEILQVDYDGDGMVDGTVSAADDLPRPVAGVTPPVVHKSSGTRVSRLPAGMVAGAATSELHHLHEIIVLMQEVVRLMIIIKNS